MRKLLVILFLLFTVPVFADTHYVRTDGGNGTQCTGLVDDDQATAVGTACAVNSPHWVFPGSGASTTRQASAGDTVVIETGSYRIGCQNASTCADTNVNVIAGTCSTGNTGGCALGTIPSNTTVIGCTVSGCTLPANRPELWGAGRIYQVLQLSGTSNVTLKDLEITDHADCGEGHNLYDCGQGSSSILNARMGVNITGATNPTLINLKIHGLQHTGLFGGSVAGMTITNTNLDYNSHGGYDGDSCFGAGTCGNTGTITFNNGTTIRYNGCVEDNPGYGTILVDGCFSQDQSNDADGVAMGSTGGTWVLDRVDISHNTSDGFDLLYSNSSSTFSIKKSKFEGNAGNQVKTSNNVYLEDNLIIGNCGYFAGQTFTNDTYNSFNNCRAYGATVATSFNSNVSPQLYSNTITGNGDGLIETSGSCTAGTDYIMKNNIFLSGAEFNTDGSTPYWHGDGVLDYTYTFYNSGSCTADFVESYNACYGPWHSGQTCTGANDINSNTHPFSGTIKQGPYTSPGYYTDANYADQLYLSAANNLSDETVSGADALDYKQCPRGSSWDAGALEYGTTPGGCGGPVPFCGDGNVDTGESCDGSNLGTCGGITPCNCSALGYDLGGTLSCSASCTFVTTLCASSVCGNGTVEALEECDDGNKVNGDGCDAFCHYEATKGISVGIAGCNMSGVNVK